MCQTSIISRSIGRLGRSSFDRRMRVVSPLYVEKRGEVTRLCNGLEKLCELLHEEFPTITRADYEVFGPELRVLISTLKDLLTDSKRVDPVANECLRERMDDLVELDNDIVNFRMHLQEDENFKQTMKEIGKLDFSRFVK